jgi:Fe-S-cluster containining protein
MTDSALIQIVDAALADATRRAGEWLACKPGCSQCCHGVFAISQLDAERLRTGLSVAEPAMAMRIRLRVQESLALIADDFPGDAATGILNQDEAAFEEFANDVPCPVLDPITQTCDLYAARPMTCRTFGPPMDTQEGGLGVCELCFIGAPAETVAACELLPDPDGMEEQLIAEAEARTGLYGKTIVSFALRNA